MTFQFELESSGKLIGVGHDGPPVELVRDMPYSGLCLHARNRYLDVLQKYSRRMNGFPFHFQLANAYAPKRRH